MELGADSQYKQSVFWIDDAKRALVEYVGNFEGVRIPHGNNRDKESQFVRTPAHTTTEIEDIAQ